MITKLTSFNADAEVLGVVRSVSWMEGSALTIHDLSLEETGRVLDLLSAGKIQGVRGVGGAPLPGGAPAPGGPPPTSAAAPPAEPVPEPARAPEAPPNVPGAPPAGAASAPSADAPPAPPPSAGAGAPDGVPPEVANAPNVRVAFQYLRDHMGLKTADEITAAVERYKAANPILQRIRDVRARVQGWLDTL